jgi:diguanylate cyclase (GGDEF)-like protein
MVRDADGLADFGTRRRWYQVREAAAHLGPDPSLQVFDLDGNAVLATLSFPARALNVSDRDYFKAIKRGDPLYIGATIQSRVGRGRVFVVAKPLRDSVGTLIGVVGIGVPTEELTATLTLLDFGVKPLLGIYRMNGDVVARVPELSTALGGNIASGVLFQQHLPQAPRGDLISVSPLDGVARFASYRTIPDYNLVALAGIPVETALGEWRRHAWLTAGKAAAMVSVMVLIWLWSMRVDRAASATETALDLARHDPLTGLAQRALFADGSRARHRRAAEIGQRVACLLIDLDGFKAVNDRLGHARGDEVLAQAAAVLRATVRASDLIGRLGGDEFAICLIADPARIEAIAAGLAERLVTAIETIGDGIGCSIGVAVGTGPQEPIEDTLKRADTAMYAAKSAGKRTFRIAAD